MLFAYIDGLKRQPAEKGERGLCPACGNEVIAVVPIQNVRHWRHRAKDCDPWTEPEGEWHLAWKELFGAEFCEIALADDETGEMHRADVRFPSEPPIVVELQHSSISEEERLAREKFYSRHHRFFWLLHIHSEKSFRGYNFGLSLTLEKPVTFAEKEFFQMTWYGNTQFIERWKNSSSHVFLSYGHHVFYLATRRACNPLVEGQKKGEFALHPLTISQFIDAVKGSNA